MEPFSDVEVEVTILIGEAEMPLERLLGLARGAVLSLGRDVAGPLTVVANGAPVAEARVHLAGDRVNVALLNAVRAG